MDVQTTTEPDASNENDTGGTNTEKRDDKKSEEPMEMDNEGNEDTEEGQEKKDHNKDLFKLVVVNSYGSQEVQKLNPEQDHLLKLTSVCNITFVLSVCVCACVCVVLKFSVVGQTYISCDWEVDIKEKYYDLQRADVSLYFNIILL